MSHVGGPGGCEQVGTRRVRGAGDGKPIFAGDFGKNGIYGSTTRKVETRSYTDADGTEEIEEWRCVPGCAVRMLDEQAGPDHPGTWPKRRGADPTEQKRRSVYRAGWYGQGDVPNGGATSTGNVSRFFFTAKASRSERTKTNTHPTVKPLSLMRWLCRLVTPVGGTVLDPFLGSGTTALAARAEGFCFIGIEKEAEYLEIAARRLAQEVLPLDTEA